MKKFIVVLVLLLAVSTVSVFAQSIEGKWLDANYDAVWEISASLTGVNVRLFDSTNGSLIYDFAGMIQNRSFANEGINPVLSFDCADTERSYKFVSNLPGTNLTMEIRRVDQPLYTVDMRKQ